MTQVINRHNITAPNPQGEGDGGMSMMYLMVAWVIIALVLYFLRPASLRRGSEKPSSRDNNQPPQPPAPIS